MGAQGPRWSDGILGLRVCAGGHAVLWGARVRSSQWTRLCTHCALSRSTR